MTLTWPCNRCGAPIEARYAAADPFDPAPYNTRLYRTGTEERHVCPKPRKDVPRALRRACAGEEVPGGDLRWFAETFVSAAVDRVVHTATSRIVTELREDRAHVEWEMRQ